MKKHLLCSLLVILAWCSAGLVNAQNLQFHYDLGRYLYPETQMVRYDGGLRFVNATQSNTAISMNDAFMTGGSYTYLRGDRRLMLSAALLYKYIRLTPQPHNFELCTVWKYAPGDGLFSATGFISFWQQADKRPGWNTRFKLMMQPQFWCNLNKLEAIPNDINLSIGSEIRISRNVDAPQWIVAPTLALKWSFR